MSDLTYYDILMGTIIGLFCVGWGSIMLLLIVLLSKQRMEIEKYKKLFDKYGLDHDQPEMEQVRVVVDPETITNDPIEVPIKPPPEKYFTDSKIKILNDKFYNEQNIDKRDYIKDYSDFRFFDPEVQNPPESPELADDELPIWARMEELGNSLSDEDIAKLPIDGAAELDHYLYGTPKRSSKGEPGQDNHDN